MTVADKLHETIGTMKGIQATLETLAIQTEDPTVKQSYLQATIDITQSLQTLQLQMDEMKKGELQS